MGNSSVRSAAIFVAVTLAALGMGPVLTPAYAGSITYITPAGATAGGQPVDASATLTTSSGSLSLTLTNLEANPTSVVQNLSDIQFTVGNGGSLTGSSQTGASSQELTVNGDGSFSIGANLTTVPAVGWVYTTTSSTGTLDVLQGPGHAGPAHLIIGPPGPGGTYSNANGSIAGNGPHNPFLNQSASFTITAPGISADTTITAVTFSFGTTEGANLVPGVPVTGIPEPSSLVLGLIGFGLVGTVGLYRKRRRS
jgi:hypothetical protein